MTSPVHRTCYRCGEALHELVDAGDALGGAHGACSQCRLTLAARDLARKWHGMHPEFDEPVKCEGCDDPATTSDGEGIPLCEACAATLEDEAEAIPREIETSSGAPAPDQSNEQNGNAGASQE